MIYDRSFGATGTSTNLGSQSRSRRKKTKSLSPYRPLNSNNNVMPPSEYHINRRKRLERAKAVIAHTRRAAQASQSNDNESQIAGTTSLSPSPLSPKSGSTSNGSSKLERHLAKGSSKTYSKGRHSSKMKTVQKPSTPTSKSSKIVQDESVMGVDALAHVQDNESFESIIPPPPSPPPVTPERPAKDPSSNSKVYKSPSVLSATDSQEVFKMQSASINLVDSIDLLNDIQITERAHFTSPNTDHAPEMSQDSDDKDDEDDEIVQAPSPPEIKRDLIVGNVFPSAVLPEGLARALSKIKEERQDKVNEQVVKSQKDHCNLGEESPSIQAKIEVSPDRSLATQETYASTEVGSPFRTPTRSPAITPDITPDRGKTKKMSTNDDDKDQPENSLPSKMMVVTSSAPTDVDTNTLDAVLDQYITKAIDVPTNISKKRGEGSPEYYNFTEDLLRTDRIDDIDDEVRHSNGVNGSRIFGNSILDLFRCRIFDSLCVCPSGGTASSAIVSEGKDP